MGGVGFTSPLPERNRIRWKRARQFAMSDNSQILGDGFYAHVDNHGTLVIVADNGAGQSQTIILKPESVRMLVGLLSQRCAQPPTPAAVCKRPID